MNPAVAEIVLLGKSLHPTQLQTANPYLAGVRTEKRGALSAQSIFTAANLKTTQVHIFPAEGDLQYVVKLCDAGVARISNRAKSRD